MASNPKYEIFKGKDDQFYFRLKAGNGEIILASEGYASKQGAQNAIESVRSASLSENGFEGREAKDGRHYFVVLAANQQVIGMSEMYDSTAGRDGGIDSVRANAPKSPVEDTTTGAEHFTNPKFQIYETAGGSFSFRLNAVNGENILQSETYTTKAAAKDGIDSVKANAEDEQFERLESTDGQFYFNLKAKNGQVIGTSERFTTADSRENSIQSVLKVATEAPVEDTTLFEESAA